MSFAWGYWHDPHSKKYGTRKIIKEAKLGYSRYLALLKLYPLTSHQAKNGRFSLKRLVMQELAEKRLKEL